MGNEFREQHSDARRAWPEHLDHDRLYNHETICRIDVTLDGAERAWEQQVASGVCSPVIHRDRVYWSSHEMFCLDWDTGDIRWRGGRFGDAGSCIATSDDRMIVWAGRGKLALVDIDPDQREYRELEQHELGALGCLAACRPRGRTSTGQDPRGSSAASRFLGAVPARRSTPLRSVFAMLSRHPRRPCMIRMRVSSRGLPPLESSASRRHGR
ncbi:MAG: hypothetical protein R3B96_08710 [Pirellulaceae bacterium]